MTVLPLRRAQVQGRRHSGFTLIELLVALTILALFSVLGYRAVVALTDAEIRLTAETAQWRGLDQLFTRLETDLRQAQPRVARTIRGPAPALSLALDFEGNAELAFSRAGPDNVLDAGSAGQRIGYRLNNGAVEVVYWPYLDVAPGAEPTAYVLAEGVRRMVVSALDVDSVWRSTWPQGDLASLPRAMRVELTLADGARVERWLVLQ